jgi:cell division protein FtsW (lipid II flippase)
LAFCRRGRLDQLAPDFATPLIREVLALLLCLFAGGLAIYGYLRWLSNEKAMRLKQDLPYTRTADQLLLMMVVVVVMGWCCMADKRRARRKAIRACSRSGHRWPGFARCWAMRADGAGD